MMNRVIIKSAASLLLISTLLLPTAFAATKTTNIYSVTKVVDGDTVQVKIGTKIETVRLIGIDTPETKDPRKPVQCFGKEASEAATKLLKGKKVRLESDPTNTNRDKYGRLLRYVYLQNGTSANEYMVQEGYAFAYVEFPFTQMDSFKETQKAAQAKGKGLWNVNTCAGKATPLNPSAVKKGSLKCKIKGNISNSGEKIYHIESGSYYAKTEIDESIGEKWFCSEVDAKNAGWRKSLR